MNITYLMAGNGITLTPRGLNMNSPIRTITATLGLMWRVGDVA